MSAIQDIYAKAQQSSPVRLSGLKTLSVALLAFSIGASHAQIRLDEALSLAVQQHPEIQAKRSQLRGANERLNSSVWQRYPSVSLQTTSAASGNNTDTINTFRLDQPLWTGGRIDADIAASEFRNQVAAATLAETEQLVMVRAGSAFSEMVRMKLRIHAAELNIAEHQRLLELIQRRAANQINPESDVVLARARLQQSRSEAIQFKNMADNAKADLEQVIGQKVQQLEVPDYTALGLLSLEDSLQEAMKTSPTVQRLEAEIKAAEADVQARKSVYWPTVSARLERVVGGVNANSAAYLALNFQPGAGLSAQSAIQEAVARKDAAQNTLESSRKDIMDKVRMDWNQRQTTLADAQVIHELVDATESLYQSFLRQFPVGRKSWMELLNARREATQAQYAMADARWTGFLAALRVAVATGKVSVNQSLDLKNAAAQ